MRQLFTKRFHRLTVPLILLFLSISLLVNLGLGVSPAQAATSTLGKTTVGSLSATGGANYLDSTGPYALSGSGSFIKLTGYLKTGASSTHIRAVIYADDGTGKPGTLVAVSQEVSLPANTAAGWVDLPLPTAVTLTAGSYWLGYWYGDSHSTEYYDNVTGSERYAPATYSSTANPPNPYGTPGTSTSAYSLYGTYTPG